MATAVTVIKTPHCKQCGHPVKGHKRPKGEKVKCEQCPRGVCTSSADGSSCNCEWHRGETRQQHLHVTMPQPLAQRQLQTPVHQPTLQIILHGSVKEWLLPPQICQSMIYGFPLGSNACTIIAAIGANKFLSGELKVPSDEDNILRSVASFADIIKYGNTLYSQINLPPGQLNLDVKEALATKSDNFSLTITDDLGLFSTACLEIKLQEICQIPEQICAILIVPPDKSMLLCFDYTQRKLGLFESHKHKIHGGVIAVGQYDDMSGFVRYLGHMLARDWHTGIPGSNISVLKKHI